jgi:FtsZ-binding cell division protein ZapB
MTLGELIYFLEKLPNKDQKLKSGFGEPMKGRGFYAEVAFPPKRDVSINEMLNNAKAALMSSCYKGGEFSYNKSTDIHLDKYGRFSDDEGEYMFNLLKQIEAAVTSKADEPVNELKAENEKLRTSNQFLREKLRTSNQFLRETIDLLKIDIEDLEIQNDRLDGFIEDFQSYIWDLENEVADLRYKLNKLNETEEDHA